MNGATNGDMDDPMDTSPSSPIDAKAKKTISEPDLELSENTISDNGHKKPLATESSTNETEGSGATESKICVEEAENIKKAELDPILSEATESNISDVEAPNVEKVESDPLKSDATESNTCVKAANMRKAEPDPIISEATESNKSDVQAAIIKKAESDPLVPPQKNIECQADENSNHSNESDADSVTSLQGKLNSNGQTDKVELYKDKNVDHVDLDEEDSQDVQDSDELDSEEDSSDEDGSEPKPVDTVSIHSDSEQDPLSDDDDDTNPQSDIVFVDSRKLDKKNGLKNIGSPSEVHEIESDNEDDCVVTSEEKPDSLQSNVSNGKLELRRSSRALKRKSYADDVQLVGIDNSKVKPKNKNKERFLNQVSSFIQGVAKHNKNNMNLKKPKSSPQLGRINPITVEDLYQSIAARGTTVTPVVKVAATATKTVAKAATATTTTITASTEQNTQTTAPPPPPVLPSLTDDMFVVEAPSFVVPYVYEKPSVKPFREFVDNLGKQLEEQRAKEELEKLEKRKADKEKSEEGRDKENVSGEGTEKSDKSVKQTGSDVEDKNKKKGRNRRKKDDDASWDGSGDESTAESDDENLSDEEKQEVVIKDIDDDEVIKNVLASTNKVSPAKTDTYFDCSLGKFFMDIGLNQVQEYVQVDLLKLHTRKLNREKKSGNRSRETEVVVASLMKNIESSRKFNEQYTHKQKKCQFCSFQTESVLVMSNHFETPHMKNGLYKCNFCPVELRTPHDIMVHMEISHKIKGKLEKAPGNHQCVNCPFEDNGKGKLARHLISCAKKYKPEVNLSPPIEWEPPAKIPKIAKARSNIMSGFTPGFKGLQINNSVVRPPMNLGHGGAGPLTAFRPRPQLPLPPRPALPSRPAILSRPNIVVRHFPPTPVGQQNKSKPASQQPSISITPLPRAPQYAAPPPPPAQGKGTFVICEICDGYIKDLEQLRNHMQWIHKVKIHPKMIYNRPPLNCQKCQFRFFTDQGLERHLLGSHGLVTSSMQEAANQGKDAGRCPVCGRVYQWKLLHHVAKDHLLTLKPAHLSYKCTVCTATFGMYKQFENHVYSAHRVVAKRVMDKSKPAETGKAADGAADKPQPDKPATVTSQGK